nr:hypothetical protein [Tanacetum cinerariifolium]
MPTKIELALEQSQQGVSNDVLVQTFADIHAFLLSEDKLDKESDEEEVLAAREDMDEDPQVAEDSTLKDLQAYAFKQKEVSAAWTKSSTNMDWNLGSRMTAIEISQTALKRQSSSTPLSSVTLTLALTNIPTNIKGENATNTATQEPPSHTEEETEDPKIAIQLTSIQPTKVPPTQAKPITTITTYPKSSQEAPRIDKGKGIATE